MMKSGRGKGTSNPTKEASQPADDRKAGKRKSAPAAVADKGSKQRAGKEKKAKKDPNKPKRPPTAFFVFLEDFRKTFKKENPNANAVSAVGKAGGQKWREMSAAEKAPYEAKAGKKKDEYGKLMDAYNNKKESEEVHGDEDSDRSKSEVNDDDDEEEDAPAVKEAPQKEKEEVVEEQDDEEGEDDEEDGDEDEDEDDEE